MKALARRLAPRQPGESGVLLGRERSPARLVQPRAEKLLGVVRDAGREAVSPSQIDLEGIGDIPAACRRSGAASIPVSSRTSRAAALVSLVGAIERASDRLPEPGRAARSRSRTSRSSVCTTTSTDNGSFMPAGRARAAAAPLLRSMKTAKKACRGLPSTRPRRLIRRPGRRSRRPRVRRRKAARARCARSKKGP